MSMADALEYRGRMNTGCAWDARKKKHDGMTATIGSVTVGDVCELARALGLSIETTTFSETIQAAIHTAALLEDAERSKVVLCLECRYWHEYVAMDHGACDAPGTKKIPWPGKPHHDTMICSADFGCVCGVRR